jgi:hypothetical protein
MKNAHLFASVRGHDTPRRSHFGRTRQNLRRAGAKWSYSRGNVILLLGLLKAACVLPDQNGGSRSTATPLKVIVHPQQEWLLSASPGVRVLDLEPVKHQQQLGQMHRAVLTFDSTRSVGDLEGSAGTVLGSIVSASFLSTGMIALVDQEYGTVRLFDRDLYPKGRLGSFGDGPGEFVRPVGVAEDSEGRLLVLNRTTGALRVELFSRLNGSYEFAQRLPLRLYPGNGGSGICSAEGRTFVTGVIAGDEAFSGQKTVGALRSPFLVHEIDSEGHILRSFSAPYTGSWEREPSIQGSDPQSGRLYERATSLDVMLHFASAQITCSSHGTARIGVAYAELGEVHFHDMNGDLLWIARIKGFNKSDLWQTIYAAGASVGGDPRRTLPLLTDKITEVSLIGPSLMAVQITRTETRRDRSRKVEFYTYLLDVDNGVMIGSFTANHKVIGGADRYALLYREALHPQIVTVWMGGMP